MYRVYQWAKTIHFQGTLLNLKIRLAKKSDKGQNPADQEQNTRNDWEYKAIRRLKQEL